MVPSVSVATTDGATLPRVLIIDDEPSIRAALRRFFTRRGWRVDEASDGAQGLALLLAIKGDFAVVVSDLKMPDVSGMELHDHIATVAPDLLDRIIFSTGDVASKDAAEFVQRTKCTVLQKPFELRALEAHVARVREMTPS
jgi:DNA-binding NtrC family response regulator